MTATSIGTAYRDATKDLVWLVLETPDTADSDDTLAVDLQTYGIAEDGFLMIIGNEHTTVNSVVTMEDPTTAVSSGTLTITLTGSSNDDKVRLYLIVGRSEV